jgi:acyl-coenzyme A thioesterase PaaI-like protein
VPARASELGLNLDHWCFACGRANPIGLKLDFEFAPGRAETIFVGRREHQGYDGALHGGIVTALLDETMGWAIFQDGTWGVTTRLALTFRSPAPIDEEIRVVGEVVRDRGRAVELRGEIRRIRDDALIATGEATYVKMSEARRRELIETYGDPGAALARLREGRVDSDADETEIEQLKEAPR